MITFGANVNFDKLITTARAELEEKYPIDNHPPNASTLIKRQVLIGNSPLCVSTYGQHIL